MFVIKPVELSDFFLCIRPVHITPEKFENAAITGHFGFVFHGFFLGNLGQGNHMIIVASSFPKSSV